MEIYSQFTTFQMRRNLFDATLISDGTFVITRQPLQAMRKLVAMMLSSKVDARNPCVPIIDNFKDTDDTSISYIVTPFLSDIDEPRLICVDEIPDLIDQFLEVCPFNMDIFPSISYCMLRWEQGLALLHENGVAHR